jgi:hypothetical protein
MQDAAHPDGAGEVEATGHDEVGDLDPSAVAEAEQADGVAGEVEALSRGRLDQHDGEEQRRCTAIPHPSRCPVGMVEPRRVLAFWCATGVSSSARRCAAVRCRRDGNLASVRVPFKTLAE